MFYDRLKLEKTVMPGPYQQTLTSTKSISNLATAIWLRMICEFLFDHPKGAQPLGENLEGSKLRCHCGDV